MEYQALYRKYRPSVFEDVKGQDIIVKTLRNQIRTGRLSHAYLFCGSRGTGKTTAAKIFARAVNCENPSDGNPCGVCESCRAIQEGRSMNVVELDAASHNGVADFRQIIDEIEYPPTSGRYRVYIIDEVHMLSGSAFNAFLKTLEEPPSYAVFILATTDPQKLPVTVLSRCQRYDFRRIPSKVIAERVMEVLKLEHAEADEKAAAYIARKADGGMRDALSLADQCMAFFPGEKLTYEHVLEVLGTVDTEVYSSMLRSAVLGDASGLLGTFHDLIMDGGDIRQIISDLTAYMRDLLLYRASGGSSRSLDMMDETRESLLRDSERVSEAELMYFIELLSDLSNSLRNTSNRRVLSEVALIRLCRPQTSPGNMDAVLSRLEQIERKIEDGSIALRAAGNAAGPASAGVYDASAKEAADMEGWDDGEALQPSGGRQQEPGSGESAAQDASAPDADTAEGERWGVLTRELFQRIRGQWSSTVTSLEDKGVGYSLARFAQPRYQASDPSVLLVVLTGFWEAYRKNEKIRTDLENLIAKKYDCRLKVRFITKQELAGSMQRRVSSARGMEEELKEQGVNFPVEMEDN